MKLTLSSCLNVRKLLLVFVVLISQLENHSYAAPSSKSINRMVIKEFNTTVFRLVVDAWKGSILVGARNWIYRLSKDDLSIIDEVQTGPVNDSSLCRPYPEECAIERKLTDNDNQILMINYVSLKSQTTNY